MNASLLALVIALTGCAMGAGSPFVGQWRARDVVTTDACLEDASGTCVARTRITAHEPARSFWGGTLSLGQLGVSSTTHGARTSTQARIEPSLELLRGHGRFALGVRASAVIDVNTGSAIPIIAVAHASLTDRLSVHAGAGPSYTARVHDARTVESTWLGARGLVGFRFALASSMGDRYIVFGADADVLGARFDEPYRTIGATGHLGLYF